MFYVEELVAKYYSWYVYSARRLRKQNTQLTVCLFGEEQFTDISLDISILA